MDFGTSDFKFGPITCGEDPLIVNNRGYFPDRKSVMYKAFQSTPDVVVGDQVPLYLQSTEDLSSRLVYPMRNGMIEKADDNAWASRKCSLPIRFKHIFIPAEQWLQGILHRRLIISNITTIHVRTLDGYFQGE